MMSPPKPNPKCSDSLSMLYGFPPDWLIISIFVTPFTTLRLIEANCPLLPITLKSSGYCVTLKLQNTNSLLENVDDASSFEHDKVSIADNMIADMRPRMFFALDLALDSCFAML